MTKFVSYLLMLGFVFTTFLSLEVIAWDYSPEADALACDRCHTCEKPTQDNPCLVTCARVDAYQRTVKHEITEAPDLITMDAISETYPPVQFDHKLHADMSQISTDCKTCHHYSPPGKIPPCRSCHPATINASDPTRTSLKVVYHRQCLSCHVEWSHNADCGLCHMIAESGTQSLSKSGAEDVLPKAPVPVSRVYTTPYNSGPVVTFQHIEHIEVLEFNCVDCHHQERCAYCHDPVRPNNNSKTLGEVQMTCEGCHEMCMSSEDSQACQMCHHQEVQTPLFHEIVGQNLPSYLERVGCEGCHEPKT